jgi:hypothetical protein
MSKINSLVIVDTINSETSFWYVATGFRDANQTRLTGAWTKRKPEINFYENIMSDRMFYAIAEGRNSIDECKYSPKDEIDVEKSIANANLEINNLKDKLATEQSQRKSYKQLTNPDWVEMPKFEELHKILETNKNNSNRPLEIAKWFANLFNIWDTFQEQKMGSLFLRKISSSDYTNFPTKTISK